MSTFITEFDAYKAEGLDKCKAQCGAKPNGDTRVWFQRARTNRGTIYLFRERPTYQPDLYPDSHGAFAWIPEHIGQTIRLKDRVAMGWCSWYVNRLSASDKGQMVVFTDDINRHANLQAVLEATNFLAQRGRSWITGERIDGHPAWAARHQTIETETRAVADHARQTAKNINDLLLTASLTTPKDQTMTSKIQATASNLLAANKQAATTAGYLEAGRLANKHVAKVAAKALPMLARGYADTPFGHLILANAAVMAAAQFRGDNKELAKLTAAMHAQAYLAVIQEINIEGVLDELLDSKDIKLAMAKLGKVDSE